eukprot:g9002.t1
MSAVGSSCMTNELRAYDPRLDRYLLVLLTESVTEETLSGALTQGVWVTRPHVSVQLAPLVEGRVGTPQLAADPPVVAAVEDCLHINYHRETVFEHKTERLTHRRVEHRVLLPVCQPIGHVYFLLHTPGAGHRSRTVVSNNYENESASAAGAAAGGEQEREPHPAGGGGGPAGVLGLASGRLSSWKLAFFGLQEPLDEAWIGRHGSLLKITTDDVRENQQKRVELILPQDGDTETEDYILTPSSPLDDGGAGSVPAASAPRRRSVAKVRRRQKCRFLFQQLPQHASSHGSALFYVGSLQNVAYRLFYHHAEQRLPEAALRLQGAESLPQFLQEVYPCAVLWDKLNAWREQAKATGGPARILSNEELLLYQRALADLVHDEVVYSGWRQAFAIAGGVLDLSAAAKTAERYNAGHLGAADGAETAWKIINRQSLGRRRSRGASSTGVLTSRGAGSIPNAVDDEGIRKKYGVGGASALAALRERESGTRESMASMNKTKPVSEDEVHVQPSLGAVDEMHEEDFGDTLPAYRSPFKLGVASSSEDEGSVPKRRERAGSKDSAEGGEKQKDGSAPDETEEFLKNKKNQPPDPLMRVWFEGEAAPPEALEKRRKSARASGVSSGVDNEEDVIAQRKREEQAAQEDFLGETADAKDTMTELVQCIADLYDELDNFHLRKAMAARAASGPGGGDHAPVEEANEKKMDEGGAGAVEPLVPPPGPVGGVSSLAKDLGRELSYELLGVFKRLELDSNGQPRRQQQALEAAVAEALYAPIETRHSSGSPSYKTTTGVLQLTPREQLAVCKFLALAVKEKYMVGRQELGRMLQKFATHAGLELRTGTAKHEEQRSAAAAPGAGVTGGHPTPSPDAEGAAGAFDVGKVDDDKESKAETRGEMENVDGSQDASALGALRNYSESVLGIADADESLSVAMKLAKADEPAFVKKYAELPLSDAASSQEEKESGAKAQPRSDEQYNARVDTQQVAEVAALEKKMVAFIAKNVVLKKDVPTVAGEVFSEKIADFRQEVLAQIREEVESQRRAIVAEVSADVREELSTHGSEVLDLQKTLKREQEAMSSEFKRMMEERMQKDVGKNEEMRTRLKMEIADARRDELKALEARREKSRVAMENTLREEMRVERQKLLDKERQDSAKEIAELNVECIHMMSDAKRRLKEQGQEARAEMRKQLVEEREKSMKETVECMKKTIEKVETAWAAKLTAMRELGTKNQERIGSALHQIELLQTEVADITASAKAFKERSDSLEAKLAEFDALHLPRAKGERGVSFDEKKPHLVGAAASSSSGDASTPGGASTEAVAKKSQLNVSNTGVDETSTTAAAAIGAADELSPSAAATRHSIQKVVEEHFEAVVAPKMASSVHAMVDAKVDAKLQDMQEHLKLMKLGIQKMGAAGSSVAAAAAPASDGAAGGTAGASKMNADAPSDAESMLSHGSVAGSEHQSDHENAKPLPKLKAITSSTLSSDLLQLPEQAAVLEVQALKADLELVQTSNKEFRRHMESNFQSYEDAILQVLETKFAQMRSESERLSTKLLTAFKTNLSKDLAKLDDRVNELEAANVGAGGGTKTAGAGSFEQQQKLLLDSILSGAAPAGGKMNSGGGATDGSTSRTSSGSDTKFKKGEPAGGALALVTADGAGEENPLLSQEHEQRVLDLCQASESRMRDHASQLARKSREGLQAVIEQLRSEFAETLTALETRIEHDYLPNLRASLISRELGVKKLSDWFCDAVALGDGSVNTNTLGSAGGNSEAADSRSNTRVYDVLASHVFRPLLFAEVQKLERSLKDAVVKNLDAGFKRLKERELPPLVIDFVEQGFADLRVEDKVKYHAGVSAEEGRRQLADMIQDLVNTHAEQQLDRLGSAVDECEKRLFSEVRKEASKQVQLAGTNLQAAAPSGAAHQDQQNKFKFSHSALVPGMSSSGAPPGGASDDATRTLVAQKLADFQRPGGALEGQLESWAGSSLSLRGMLQRMLEREVAQLQAVFRLDLEEHKTGTQFAQEQKGEQLRGEILQEFSSMMREHREQLQKELAAPASQFTALSYTTAEAGRGSGSNFYGSSAGMRASDNIMGLGLTTATSITPPGAMGPSGSSRQLETVVKHALVQQLQQSDFLKQAIRNKTEELRLKLEQRIDSESRALEQKLRGLEQNCLSELRGCVRENHLEARVADLKEEIGSVLDEFHGSFVVERMSKLDRELDLLREEVRRQREQVQIMDSRYNMTNMGW